MSTVKVDTLVASDGTSPVTLTQQSAARSFVAYAHDSGTPTAKESLNVSSLTDTNTGNTTINYTNNTSVANHCVVALANYRSGSAQFKHITRNEYTFSTSSYALISGEGAFTTKDAENISACTHGDLA